MVVGSGIAGAELATFLARHGRDVVLLESGREAFDPAIQALNDLVFAGKRHRQLDPEASYHRYLPDELRGVSRVRQFGGTSNVWTGKWKHFQASDFVARPWVPVSEWPIRLDDLLGHYRSAAADYRFGDLEAEAERPALAPLRAQLAAAGLKVTSFYWEENPTRTPVRFGSEMARSDRLKVVLGATVTELIDDGGTIGTAVCRSLEGRMLTVRGRTFILATGALEAARLLLASSRTDPRGIGNAHDLVGRYYSDHPKHHSGTLHPGELCRQHATELQYGPKPRFCLCFALDDATQAEHRLLEHVIYLKPIYETRRARAARFVRGRPACRDGLGAVSAYRVKLVTEQMPNRESRVRLGAERDALGMPRLVLDWRLREEDRRSLAAVVALAEERFRRAGLGAFDFSQDPPDLETMTDAAHQMGTTRMSSAPEGGVVDPDCRVWGTDNLYVASSAVFPTGPSYSPTFTILALARRLGEHLLGAAGHRA
ncbi:MAG TPA: GMC family oxidoreductase [Falsiroseomonas sp.]|nr:GMC family oxidoreductase [Falsiroseomonas sp.]